VPVVDKFLADLEASVAQVRQGKSSKGGNAAIYGMAASIPDKSLVDEVACSYLDIATELRKN
jgi:sphinganine-1-phosphate aldolase